MMRSIFQVVMLLTAFACAKTDIKTPTSLKEAYNDKFMIGVALSDKLVIAGDSIQNMIGHEFNSIVAENCMKSEIIQPEEGVFDFHQSDRFVECGEAHNMFIIGHTLVWHSQVPDWIFVDKDGNDVSREVLIERMRKHISTLVGRYKGRVHGWDVVNEAILGSGELRKSKWLEIIGEDYIELAFQFAHEADPDAELYYNDYGMDNPKKREAVVELVKKLKKKSIPIHGVGMQAHYALNLSIKEFEESVSTFSDLGVNVMITELDITVLPFPTKRNTADVNMKEKYRKELNPYPDGLPEDVQNKFTELYKSIFKVLLKHKDNVSRVTFWGLNDNESWKNNWPVRGRTDYPLLFDRNNNPKPAYYEVIELAKQNTYGQ